MSATLYVSVALMLVLPPKRVAFVASSAGLTEPTRITETAWLRVALGLGLGLGLGLTEPSRITETACA